jgi:hypothetical protein
MKTYPINREDAWISGTFCLLLKLIGESIDDPNYSAESEFSNEFFTIRPYYWGDEDDEIEKPNFEIPSENFSISWYKYPFRTSESNVKITPSLWNDLIQKCIKSLEL